MEPRAPRGELGPGLQHDRPRDEPSAARNAVSKLHREVSSKCGATSSRARRSLTYITNGVHTWSWLAPEMAALLDRHGGGKAWREEIERPASWSFVDEIHRASWETHRATKRRMAEFVNHRLRGKAGSEALDPDALTIGFARRFATYKRATLLLTDPERLRRIANPDRGSVPLRRQGSPCRRAGQGVHQGAVQGIRRRLRRAPRDPRGLRYGRCSPPRARR